MSTNLDERLVEAATGALELFGVHLGTRLGLYSALVEHGPLTATELADRAGIDPRYAREWLEQQAVAGVLHVDSRREASERRYELPAAHIGAVYDVDDAAHVAPLSDMIAGAAKVLDDVAEAYRSGGGVPYRSYGEHFRSGQGGINRPVFTHDLTGAWLPAIPDVHERLGRPGARIADLGCGQGFSTIALARAYPGAEVTGIDSDAASIDDARRYAREAGVRVRFVTGDAVEAAAQGPFDAVFVLEALHDFAQPVEALRSAQKSLAEGGSVIIVDERVQPEFTAPGDLVERLMYGWSIVHCLPTQMAEQPSAAIGTVFRASHVEELAREAGFTEFETTDIDADFLRVYRAR